MAKHWTDIFSYLTGAIRYNDLGYMVLTSDEAEERNIPVSHIIQWEPEGWGNGGEVRWRTAGVAIAKHPLEQFIVVGEFGNVLLIGNGDRHEEIITGSTDRGPLRGVRCIDDEILVVGMNRQVYKRIDAHQWITFDEGIDRPEDVTGFESINGFNRDSLYAVGWDGEIWHCSNGKWFREKSIVDTVLVDVCCADDGFTYACGRNGVLIRGKNGHWESLSQNNFTESLWSLAWFDGKLYASSMENVFVLQDNNTLSAVYMGEDRAETCYKLATGAGLMWSVGAKDVMCFDGNSWTRVD